MSTFNEVDHPRGRAGKFTEKAYSEPETTLHSDTYRCEAQGVLPGDILRTPGDTQSWFGGAILHNRELRSRFSAAGMPHDFIVLSAGSPGGDDNSERVTAITVDFDGDPHTFYFHPEGTVELADRGNRPARPYIILQYADDDEFFDAPIGSKVETEEGTFTLTSQYEWEDPAGGAYTSSGELWQFIENKRARMTLPTGWMFSDRGWFRRSENN